MLEGTCFSATVCPTQNWKGRVTTPRAREAFLEQWIHYLSDLVQFAPSTRGLETLHLPAYTPRSNPASTLVRESLLC
jgi:hypothetical protein